MHKPLLTVITGRPASGKTTLAHRLSQEINCPVISRDALKEGYINTIGDTHNKPGNEADWHIYNTFFEVIGFLISKNISFIAEAAFQHKSWEEKLLNFSHRAAIKIIICEAPLGITRQRFQQRLADDSSREKFHNDRFVNEEGELKVLFTDEYKPVNINLPTLKVDTKEGYDPGLKEIINFIRL